jgi:hypothetical protein
MRAWRLVRSGGVIAENFWKPSPSAYFAMTSSTAA